MNAYNASPRVTVLPKAKGVLMKVDLSNNFLASAGAKCLADALEGNQTVSELNIAGNSLGKKAASFGAGVDLSGVNALANAFATMGALERLDISENKLGPAGAMHIAEVVSKCR